MPATYEPIATTTLGTATANITFSSIPATYTDLRIVLVCTSAVNGDNINFRYNGDTATNYSMTWLGGNGTSPYSSRATSNSYLTFNFPGSTSSTIPNFYTADIFLYALSVFKKALLTAQEDKNGSGNVINNVGLWRSTAAITSILLYPASGNFNANTTATLYGIKAA